MLGVDCQVEKILFIFSLRLNAFINFAFMYNQEGAIVNLSDTNEAYRAFKPWLTYIVLAICVLLFFGLNYVEPNWQAYNQLGLSSIMDLRAGDYWSIITNNFMHLEWWHLLFNMYWLIVLGKQIEYLSGRRFLVSLMLLTAAGASALQVFISDNVGLGFSGIGYGMFGFIWANSRYLPQSGYSISKSVVNIFVAWFFMCIILTKFSVIEVGNAGHLGGLLAGLGLAWVVFNRTSLKLAIYSSVMILVLLPSFWAPWSISAMSHNAYKLHEQQRLEEALIIYNKVLHREPDNQFAKTNKNVIEVYHLSSAFQIAIVQSKFDLADSLLNEVVAISPNDPWAEQQKRVLRSLRNVEFEILPPE